MALGILGKGRLIMNRALTLLAVLATAALTVGCAPGDEPTSAPIPSVQQAEPTPKVEAPRSDDLPLLSTEAGGEFATLQSQREAAQLAETTMAVFVAHDRSYDAWWADLAQYLTPEAAMVWEYTDPRLVEATSLVGPAVVIDAPSSTLVVVDVPTDTGSWRLEVVKWVEVNAGPGVWKIFSLQPPELH